MNFIPCTYEQSSNSALIKTGEDSVLYHLPDDIQQKTSGLLDGVDLILGVRPEDVYIHTELIEEGIECQMVLMEALGSENIHHLQRGELLLVSRTSPADVYPEGQTVWVTFEHGGIRLFDRKTEAAV
jgi:ABC-type sugar transport system ATPase subunit